MSWNPQATFHCVGPGGGRLLYWWRACGAEVGVWVSKVRDPKRAKGSVPKEKGREASWARREDPRTWGKLGERHRDGETKRPRAGANRGTRERHQRRTWAQSSCGLLQFLLWDLQYNLQFLVEQTEEKLNLLYSWLGKTEAAPCCSWTSSELEVIQRGSRLSAGILSPPSPDRHLASIWTQSDRAIPAS